MKNSCVSYANNFGCVNNSIQSNNSIQTKIQTNNLDQLNNSINLTSLFNIKQFLRTSILLISLILLVSNVMAFSVNTVDDFEINDDSGFFFVEINNPFSDTRELNINFFVVEPTEIEIIAPNEIPGNSTITAKIILKNNFNHFTKINSTLEIYLGKDLFKKNILIRFYPTNSSLNNNPNNWQNNGSIISGQFLEFAPQFLLVSLNNFLDFSFETEFVLLFFLTLVILSLFVMLVVRISGRL